MTPPQRPRKGSPRYRAVYGDRTVTITDTWQPRPMGRAARMMAQFTVTGFGAFEVEARRRILKAAGRIYLQLLK